MRLIGQIMELGAIPFLPVFWQVNLTHLSTHLNLIPLGRMAYEMNIAALYNSYVPKLRVI